VQNGQIVELKGGCYVKVQIIMPIGSEIEVYNKGVLLTNRFIAMDNITFLEQLDDATWAVEKFVVIENFVTSYVGNKVPTLTCEELGKVIDEFTKGEDQLKALRRLHFYVSDRGNLWKMIDDEFGHFEKEEARKIVGLK
jgi:hypothetical protein